MNIMVQEELHMILIGKVLMDFIKIYIKAI